MIQSECMRSGPAPTSQKGQTTHWQGTCEMTYRTHEALLCWCPGRSALTWSGWRTRPALWVGCFPATGRSDWEELVVGCMGVPPCSSLIQMALKKKSKCPQILQLVIREVLTSAMQYTTKHPVFRNRKRQEQQ